MEILDIFHILQIQHTEDYKREYNDCYLSRGLFLPDIMWTEGWHDGYTKEELREIKRKYRKVFKEAHAWAIEYYGDDYSHRVKLIPWEYHQNLSKKINKQGHASQELQKRYIVYEYFNTITLKKFGIQRMSPGSSNFIRVRSSDIGVDSLSRVACP